MLSKSLTFAAVLSAAACVSTSPLPQPQGGPAPGPFPPNDPSASLCYSDGSCTTVQLYGDYLTALKECRGLAGTSGIVYLQTQPPYPNGQTAWDAILYTEAGCDGRNAVAQLSSYHGKGTPLKDANGNVILAKSIRLVPH